MLEVVARRVRYVGEPSPLRILRLLSAGEKSVGELVETLQGNDPHVSKHLQVVYDSGLISRRKEGASNVYSICDPIIFELRDLVCRSVDGMSRRRMAEIQRLGRRTPGRRQLATKNRRAHHANRMARHAS